MQREKVPAVGRRGQLPGFSRLARIARVPREAVRADVVGHEGEGREVGVANGGVETTAVGADCQRPSAVARERTAVDERAVGRDVEHQRTLGIAPRVEMASVDRDGERRGPQRRRGPDDDAAVGQRAVRSDVVGGEIPVAGDVEMRSVRGQRNAAIVGRRPRGGHVATVRQAAIGGGIEARHQVGPAAAAVGPAATKGRIQADHVETRTVGRHRKGARFGEGQVEFTPVEQRALVRGLEGLHRAG